MPISDDSALFLLALGHGLDWRHLHPEDRPAAARKCLEKAAISDRSLARLLNAIEGDDE